MSKLAFNDPVSVSMGVGIPVEIDTVERAHALLNDWPVWRRGPAHIAAINACKAAIAGTIDVETARSALSAFVERTYSGADIDTSHSNVIRYERPGLST